MLRLRTARGLRVKAYRELTGRDFLRDHKQLVHALHRHGLVRIKDGYLRLTRNGMLVSNSILERFFDASRDALRGVESSGTSAAESSVQMAGGVSAHASGLPAASPRMPGESVERASEIDYDVLLGMEERE